MDNTALWRLDIDPLQLILRRDTLLDQLCNLALGLPELLSDVTTHILVDLDDLQFDLGNLSLGFRGRRHKLSMLSLDTRRIALQSCDPLDGNEVFAPELANADELAADELGFLLLASNLLGEPLDLLGDLPDLFSQLRLLPLARAVAKLK